LARYVGDVRAYLCPGRYRHQQRVNGTIIESQWLTSYGILRSMNAVAPEDWAEVDRGFRAKYSVGRTVLFVRKTSELVDPGPAARAVFLDQGDGGGSPSYCPGISEVWRPEDYGNIVWFAPIHHSGGTCFSFADGHVEYWKWMEPETVAWTRHTYLVSGPAVDQSPRPPMPRPDGPDYVRFFRAVWGKWPSR
jgi:prepilin-type processing-associated H-X9-DG protein